MKPFVVFMSVVTLGVGIADADVQTFVNDFPSFAASAGRLSTIDFETQPNGQSSQPGIGITSAYNYDADGAHFSAPVNTPFLGGNPVGGFDLRVTIQYPEPSSRNWIIADPLEPVLAAGGAFGGSSYLYAYDESDQLIGWTYFNGGGAGHFLGIVSSTPIDYVVFDRQSYHASIGAFYFAPIPEPATVLLLALASVTLRRMRRHE